MFLLTFLTALCIVNVCFRAFGVASHIHVKARSLRDVLETDTFLSRRELAVVGVVALKRRMKALFACFSASPDTVGRTEKTHEGGKNPPFELFTLTSACKARRTPASRGKSLTRVSAEIRDGLQSARQYRRLCYDF